MKVRIDGSEIAYEVDGNGPAVLLLHAFPLASYMWQPQVEALRATHRVLRFDARGFGESAAGSGPLTMERIADDAAALLERLGIERAALVGCSMGGYAAFAFARRHPARLAALVLQDTRAGADTEEARQNRHALAARVLREGPEALVTAFLPKLLGETSQRERPELLARVRARILAVSPTAAADALAGLAARADSTPALAGIRVPALVLVGEEDLITPATEAEAMAAAIAGARYLKVPLAGHLANLENPAPVNAALIEFLSGLGS
jgi:3-oxoadipate enol-lactonase